MPKESTEQSPRFRFSLRTLFIVFTVVAVIVGGVIAMLRSVERVVADAYREQRMGYLLVDFMEANKNRWPKDWKELERFAEQLPHSHNSFDDFHKHMDIDFTFEPSTVDTSIEFDDSKPCIRATWQRGGSNAHWKGVGANEIIFLYLQVQAAERRESEN